ncbi:hypothetical protein [Holdemanella sp.]|uniref:hypothetical protein n=1 Tax=Holdemanella sp. TaxID=1971762 RepID=UPI003AF111E4
MKSILDKNQIKVSMLQVPATGIIPDKAVVKSVRVSYSLDGEGKRTDKVSAIRYDCVNSTDFSTFTIKVESTKAVLTQENIEESEVPLYISIPVEQVVIKPYAIEYGIAKVSIVAPYVKAV